jgi:hypothetical protein
VGSHGRVRSLLRRLDNRAHHDRVVRVRRIDGRR